MLCVFTGNALVFNDSIKNNYQYKEAEILYIRNFIEVGFFFAGIMQTSRFFRQFCWMESVVHVV